MSFGEGLIAPHQHYYPPPAGKPVILGSSASDSIFPAGPASRSLFATENNTAFN